MLLKNPAVETDGVEDVLCVALESGDDAVLRELFETDGAHGLVLVLNWVKVLASQCLRDGLNLITERS